MGCIRDAGLAILYMALLSTDGTNKECLKILYSGWYKSFGKGYQHKGECRVISYSWLIRGKRYMITGSISI